MEEVDFNQQQRSVSIRGVAGISGREDLFNYTTLLLIPAIVQCYTSHLYGDTGNVVV